MTDRNEKLCASNKKHSRKEIQPHNPTPPSRKEKKKSWIKNKIDEKLYANINNENKQIS